jgi:hypothetical protein
MGGKARRPHGRDHRSRQPVAPARGRPRRFHLGEVLRPDPRRFAQALLREEGQDKEKKEQLDKKDQESKEQKEEQKKLEKQKLPDDVRKRLEDMNMNEQKAKMILDAMKNQEAQYLQQNKRKATKPKDKGKPDW